MGLEEKMKMSKEEADSEKEKYTKENVIEKSKRLKQTVDTYAMEEALEEMKERNEELVEKIEKSKNDHEEEKERLRMRYEVQSSNDSDKVTKANEEIVSLESESKKA